MHTATPKVYLRYQVSDLKLFLNQTTLRKEELFSVLVVLVLLLLAFSI